MKHMSISHLNLRSIFTGFTELVDLVARYSFTFVCMTETWLQAHHPSSIVAIPDYKLFRCDRLSRGGGVGVYVKDSIACEVITFDFELDAAFEQLWLKFKISNKKYALGVLYRPPNSNFLNFVEQVDTILSVVFPTVDEVICVGDVNINFLTNDNNLLSQCFDSYGFRQLINEPTRITAQSSTLLDPIFVSNKNLVMKSGIVNADLISDHHLVYCEYNSLIPKFKPKIIKFRDYRNFDINQFNRDLVQQPWFHIIRENNIDTKLDIFASLLVGLFNIHAPIRTVRVTKPKSPWLTDALLLMIEQKDRALKKYKRSKNIADYEQYKRIRNLTSSALRNEKRAYIHNFVENENNPKKTWKALESLNVKLKKNNYTIPERLANSQEINRFLTSSINPNDQDCRDTINYYENRTFNPNVNFTFHMTTIEDVTKIIRELKSTAYGIDDISSTMLKYCSPFLDIYIVHIINCCIEHNYFPNNWKQAIVNPIPKVANPLTFGDLRPISILSVLSKIMEKVLYKQLFTYFTQNYILPKHQSGFRKCHSTTTALADILHNIVSVVDDGDVAALVLLDYSKAFDTINHKVILSKLKYYGVEGSSLNLLDSYLTDRQQRVIVEHDLSDCVTLRAGVPQGSVLGPLLFIIYTADLMSTFTNCYSHAYADDKQLVYRVNTNNLPVFENHVNTDLENVYQKSRGCNLSLNSNKSCVLFFGSQKKVDIVKASLNIKINNNSIPVVEHKNNLGLIFDTKLKFTLQVNKVVQKSYVALKLLYANKELLDLGLKKSLTETMVLSHFNYGDYIYGPHLNVIDKARIQRVQNSCCRFIHNLRKYDHISTKFKELSWLNMVNRWKHHLAFMVHKVIYTSTPAYLKEMLIQRSNLHQVNLRNVHSLHIPRHRTTLFRKSFLYNAVVLYNSLPNYLKDLSISRFKLKSKFHFLQTQ